MVYPHRKHHVYADICIIVEPCCFLAWMVHRFVSSSSQQPPATCYMVPHQSLGQLVMCTINAVVTTYPVLGYGNYNMLIQSHWCYNIHCVKLYQLYCNLMDRRNEYMVCWCQSLVLCVNTIFIVYIQDWKLLYAGYISTFLGSELLKGVDIHMCSSHRKYVRLENVNLLEQFVVIICLTFIMLFIFVWLKHIMRLQGNHLNECGFQFSSIIFISCGGSDFITLG